MTVPVDVDNLLRQAQDTISDGKDWLPTFRLSKNGEPQITVVAEFGEHSNKKATVRIIASALAALQCDSVEIVVDSYIKQVPSGMTAQDAANEAALVKREALTQYVLDTQTSKMSMHIYDRVDGDIIWEPATEVEGPDAIQGTFVSDFKILLGLDPEALVDAGLIELRDKMLEMFDESKILDAIGSLLVKDPCVSIMVNRNSEVWMRGMQGDL